MRESQVLAGNPDPAGKTWRVGQREAQGEGRITEVQMIQAKLDVRVAAATCNDTSQKHASLS